YLPVLVSNVNGPVGEASAIGLVTGLAALVGALVAPVGGWIGDRVGFRPVLIACLVGAGVVSVFLPFAPSVPVLAALVFLSAGLYAGVAPMVFSLLATEVPAERRSQTLNLVYLPLYVAGIVGPALASQTVRFGLAVPFFAAAVVYVAGGILIATQVRARRAGEAGSDAASREAPGEAPGEAEARVETTIG